MWTGFRFKEARPFTGTSTPRAATISEQIASPANIQSSISLRLIWHRKPSLSPLIQVSGKMNCLLKQRWEFRFGSGVTVTENVSAAVFHAEPAFGADQLIVDVFEVAVHSGSTLASIVIIDMHPEAEFTVREKALISEVQSVITLLIKSELARLAKDPIVPIGLSSYTNI